MSVLPESMRNGIFKPDKRIDKALIPSILACVILFAGVLAVLLGQTDSWDLRNYHLYDGWAFWTGRGWYDWAAAQTQTYFNPLLATAEYLLFMHTPPRLSAFVLGALQGANILPLYAIARRLLADTSQAQGRYLALLIAFIGVAGATQLSELGSGMGDNLVSLPLLCAFALAFDTNRLNARRAALVGLLIGATVGIKLTTAPFVLGLALALPALTIADRQWQWRNVWVAWTMAACAFLITDAFWMLRVWQEFGNPLHPMFSHLFGGDFATPFNLRDKRFLPRDLTQWLFYPLVWASSSRLVSESWFLDLRVPLAFVALPVLLFWPIRDIERGLRIRILALALSVAYVAWLIVFGIYRYLVPLEMLSPLLIVLALERISGRYAWRIGIGILVVILLTTRPFFVERLPAYGPRFLDIELPGVPNLAHANVVLVEDSPLAFLALGFPPTTTFTRIGGNLMGPPIPVYGMDREAKKRIDETRGPLYALLVNPHSTHTTRILQRAGLSVRPPCKSIQSNLLPHEDHARLCSLQRTR